LSPGFAILLINYRGSTGLGKDYVESLLGKIGTADVRDVYNAVKSNPMWCNRKLLLYGGSHGGFLVTHLSGQYPVSIRFINMILYLILVTTILSIRNIFIVFAAYFSGVWNKINIQ